MAAGYLALFRAELRGNDRKQAVAALREGANKASNRREILWDLGRILIDQGDLDEAQEAIDKLRKLPADEQTDPTMVDYLDAQVLWSRGKWLLAAKAFDGLSRRLAQPAQNTRSADAGADATQDMLKEVQYRLARCYEQLGDTEAQLAAYRTAAKIDPLWAPARMGVAATLAALGNVGEALEEYRQVGRLEGMAATADFQVARLLVLRNLRLRATKDDWNEVKSILDRLTQPVPATDLILLRAEAEYGQGHVAETEKLLDSMREKYPDRTEIWAASVTLANRQQHWDRAAELLAAADKRFGDRAWLRLARGEYLLARKGKNSVAELVKLGEAATQFPAEERLNLDRGLAMYVWEAGAVEPAKQLARAACEADRTNLAVRLLMFELTYLSQDTSGMEKVLAEIAEFQPEGALWHYGEAVRLALLADQEKDAQKQSELFSQALTHLGKARDKRPGWGRVPLLAARLYDRKKQIDLAIDNYCAAIDGGEIGPAVVRRAFELLYKRQRYAEADEMLRHLEQRQAVFVTDLGRLASEVSLRLENVDRAVQISQQVAEQSKDWADHLWLGELQRLLGNRALADQRPDLAQACFTAGEKSFRRAVDLSRTTPDTWVGLVRFLASTGRKEEGQAVLKEATANIPSDKAALALAQCYEALGNLPDAEKQYRAVLAKGANDPLVLRRVAEFYLRIGRPADSQPHLQKIISKQVGAEEEQVAWARRAMARVLREKGGYANQLQAEALLDQNLAAAGTSARGRPTTCGKRRCCWRPSHSAASGKRRSAPWKRWSARSLRS